MGVLALSAILVAGAGFYLFSRSYPNYKPGSNKIEKDIVELRNNVLSALNTDLAPLNSNDLENLSCRVSNSSTRSRFTKNFWGTLVSIFQEPMVDFHLRQYLSNKKDVLIFARTEAHEFTFWTTGGQTQMTVDKHAMGMYDRKTGVLLGARSKGQIAELSKNKSEGMPLYIQGVEVANLNKKLANTGNSPISQRVFIYAKSDLGKEEEAIVTAIAIFEVIMAAYETK